MKTCEWRRKGLIRDSASSKWSSDQHACVETISVAERYALARSFDGEWIASINRWLIALWIWICRTVFCAWLHAIVSVSGVFFRAISNLALQAIEKVLDVSRNSARWHVFTALRKRRSSLYSTGCIFTATIAKTENFRSKFYCKQVIF